MAKNIILLADGTGNSAAKFNKTNVWRLYDALTLSPPGAGQPPDQIAYYHDGVGTSSFKPYAVLGGALGVGLARNVIDMYMFLCRHYEDGDRIYGFGFSRGAFTMRVLTGLVTRVGLVREDDERRLRQLSTEVYKRYRKARYLSGARRLGRAVRKKLGRATDDSVDTTGLQIEHQPRVSFLGLWDTVAAYGLPFDELTRAWDFIFPMSIPDCDLSSKVDRACHALALDDERRTFHPVLWNEEGVTEEKESIDDERITQVWFTGMHSNVGGGYPDDALANVTLHWMMQRAQKAGLTFNPDVLKDVSEASDVLGNMEDSRRGFGGLYRYMPRKMSQLLDQKDPKVVVRRPKVHESVLNRIAAGTAGYAPIVLPASYAVVDAYGKIHDTSKAPSTHGGETADRAAARVTAQESVWDLVWWRRGVYFASVVAAMVLALSPWLGITDVTSGNPVSLVSTVARWLLVPQLLGLVGAFLPDFVGSWLRHQQANPGTFVVMATAFAGLLVWGGRLKSGIKVGMRQLWYLRPESASLPTTFVYQLRTHPLYRGFVDVWSNRFMPIVVGALVVVAILIGIARWFDVARMTSGLACVPSTSIQTRFESKHLCWASGVEAVVGRSYRISIMLDGEWLDLSHPADLRGFEAMPGAEVLRRHAGLPWFMPMLRIGSIDGEALPLRGKDVVVGENGRSLVAKVEARRSGHIFLYVNDAVDFPFYSFYGNNVGTATVKVEEIAT